jgi:hypothetical protein
MKTFSIATEKKVLQLLHFTGSLPKPRRAPHMCNFLLQNPLQKITKITFYGKRPQAPIALVVDN